MKPSRPHTFTTIVTALLAAATTAFATTQFAYHFVSSPTENIAPHITLVLPIIAAFAFSLATLVLHYHGSLEQSRARTIALARESKQFSSLIENIPDVIWSFDQNGTPLYVSPQSRAILGYSPQDLLNLGKNSWWGLIHPQDLPMVKKAYENLMTAGVSMDIQYRIKRPDGSLCWVRQKSTYVGKIGNDTQAVGIFSDITKFKEATSELEKRSTDLANINTIMIGREVRMADLKKQLDELQKKTSFDKFIGKQN